MGKLTHIPSYEDGRRATIKEVIVKLNELWNETETYGDALTKLELWLNILLGGEK